MPAQLIPVAAAAALLVSLAAVGLSLVVWHALRRWRRAVEDCREQLQAIRHDLRGLCAGAVGLDGRVARMEGAARRLKERHEQLELRERGERPYAQAIRMVHKGAGIDEVMDVCELSRSEAELIVMMHRVDQTG